jgi:hypothetical protein
MMVLEKKYLSLLLSLSLENKESVRIYQESSCAGILILDAQPTGL